MDLSKLTDEELKAVAAGDLSKLSTQALQSIAGTQQPAMVYEEAPGISISYPTGEAPREQPKQPEEQRPIADELGRQVGLTTRAGVTGVTSIPMMAGDALNALINSIAGTNLPPATQSLQNLMTTIGLPQPETKTERISGDVASSIAGIGGLAKLGQVLMPRFSQPLTENIGLQTAGALGGTTAASLGREEGLSPMSQIGLGLLGGTVAPTAVTTTAGRAATGAREIVRPFTEPGREKIVGEVLRGLAREPDVAAQRAATYQPTIPGYQPTTAQATRDVGLIAAETPIRALDTTGRFAQQAAQANQIRMAIVDRLAKSNDDVLAAIEKRDLVTAPLREQAFAKSTVTPEMFKSAVTLTVNKTVNNILQSPAGKRSTVMSVVKEAQDDVSRASTPAELYEIRKDLRARSQGLLSSAERGGPDSGAYKVAKNELNQIIAAVDDAIEAAAPGYRDYLRKYAAASKGIERMEAAQNFRSKVITTTPDPMNQGQFLISQPSFTRAIRAARDDKNLKGLSKTQFAVLEKVSKDLDEGVLQRATKVPGSDTFKNLSTANVIGGIIGKQMFGEMSPALQKIATPMNWLYNGTDDRIRELLVEAMLDPKLASRLMAKASQTTMETISKELQRKAINMGYGAAFGLGQ